MSGVPSFFSGLEVQVDSPYEEKLPYKDLFTAYLMSGVPSFFSGLEVQVDPPYEEKLPYKALFTAYLMSGVPSLFSGPHELDLSKLLSQEDDP